MTLIHLQSRQKRVFESSSLASPVSLKLRNKCFGRTFKRVHVVHRHEHISHHNGARPPLTLFLHAIHDQKIIDHLQTEPERLHREQKKWSFNLSI